MKKLMLSGLLMALTMTVLGQGYKPGDEARDFKLKNVDDKMVSLADYPDAKGFIVIFSTNHCPYVVAYEDRMIELDKMFKPKGYPVIAINPNDPKAFPEDSFENMKVRAKEKGFTFPYLFDATQEIAKAYGATRTPHVFLLKKEMGKHIVKYIGAIDDNYQDASAVKEKYVANAIADLEAGSSVKVKETKAIGCSIKWKK
ncbi:thioredoxin family protein [Thermophagus sp. OGC60D27]|uniref:thioredoxin family protein n=1 Tax=Thermophagus sp. OGC60D27 TaxID=3458415 RepID=UPI0040377E81